MNSPFANIFLDLQNRITAQVPAVIFIDMDYGQLETKGRPSVAFPCILLDFKSWKFQELSLKAQTGDGIICVKIATDPYSSTSNITPETYKEAALSILDLEWQIYRALEGYKPVVAVDNTNTPTQAAHPMVRASIETDNRRPGLKVRELYFTTAFTDYSAKLQTTLAPATPVIADTIVV